MTLATTVSLAVLRGPVPLAKTLAAIDLLSGGRLVAAVGPGSSARDYDALGIPFEERWKRFDEAISLLRALLEREPPPGARTSTASRPTSSWHPRRGGHPVVDRQLGLAGRPRPRGAGRATAGSRPPTTRRRSASPPRALASPTLSASGAASPAASRTGSSTMWTWVAERSSRGRSDARATSWRRSSAETPSELRGQVCVGSAEHCAELLTRYAEAGCERVFLWPLGDEQRQLEQIAGEVIPQIGG